ncbi:type IV secretion system protein [Photobacterium indicum]|uniref:type IV secretion system protein n=1 Tax=Photobacterium indicum TaxID=81447 RepID=UPI003D109AEB
MVGIFSVTISPLLGACVTLYVVFLAYQALYEPQNLIVMESIKFIASLSAVTFIAFNTVWYLDNVVPSVLGSGDQIARALLGTDSAGGGASLQGMFDTICDQIVALFDNIDLTYSSLDSWLNMLLKFMMIIITLVGAIPFLGVACAYLLVAKVMVGFLLILGPLFIMMAFFPSTRSFFQAWTGQCFNYTLLSTLYPLAFTLFLQLLNELVFSQDISLVTCILTSIVFLCCLMISVQIPTFCSTLSGGIGINGLVGGIGTALSASKVAPLSKGAAKLAGTGIGKGIGKLTNIGKGKLGAG